MAKPALASNTRVLIAVIGCPTPLRGSCWTRAWLLSGIRGRYGTAKEGRTSGGAWAQLRTRQRGDGAARSSG